MVILPFHIFFKQVPASLYLPKVECCKFLRAELIMCVKLNPFAKLEFCDTDPIIFYQCADPA